MPEFILFSEAVSNLAVTLPRMAAAFIVLPLLTQDTIPSLVRNIFLVSLAIVVFPFINQELSAISGIALAPVILKELFIGLVIGFSFSIVFWALEGAGQVIDNAIGSTTAQIVDPLMGHQVTLTGAFLSRLAVYLFITFGGLLIFLELLFLSYTVWPIAELLPNIQALGQVFFIERFADLMRLTLLLAAPALAVLTLVEFGLGFVNRYAQQLNVFSLSMPVKAWLGIFIVLLMLGNIVEILLEDLGSQRNLLETLQQILPASASAT